MINEQAEYDQAMRDPHNWGPVEINDYYNRNWDITLAELAIMTGYSVKELKAILMGGEL